jgi:hypothetical protein
MITLTLSTYHVEQPRANDRRPHGRGAQTAGPGLWYGRTVPARAVSGRWPAEAIEGPGSPVRSGDDLGPDAPGGRRKKRTQRPPRARPGRAGKNEPKVLIRPERCGCAASEKRTQGATGELGKRGREPLRTTRGARGEKRTQGASARRPASVVSGKTNPRDLLSATHDPRTTGLLQYHREIAPVCAGNPRRGSR